jgi:hypothetical protein
MGVGGSLNWIINILEYRSLTELMKGRGGEIKTGVCACACACVCVEEGDHIKKI